MVDIQSLFCEDVPLVKNFDVNDSIDLYHLFHLPTKFR
jgi:hypothetical protein